MNPHNFSRHLYTRRWGLEQCKAYFRLTDNDEHLISGDRGREFLYQIWKHAPEAFYKEPLQLLRQEWYHTQPFYRHDGFWIELSDDDTVLDYGAGVGAVSQPWLLRGGFTYFVEPPGICRDYVRHKYRGWAFMFVDEPEDAGPMIDALICVDVLEHIPDPMAMQIRLWNLLKPGGHALLKMDKAYPHAGHLAESVAKYDAWKSWLRLETEIIEFGTYCWCRKPMSPR